MNKDLKFSLMTVSSFIILMILFGSQVVLH
jgi:hypothetical protein